MGQLVGKLCDKGNSDTPVSTASPNTRDSVKKKDQSNALLLNSRNAESAGNGKSFEGQQQSFSKTDQKSGMKTAPKQELTIKDFDRLTELGSGAYGDVILVKKKTNGKIFAMKIIKKSKIVERNLNPQMIIEKNVLLENKHPFLVRLKYSFQTEKKLYLVMEYCTGGELYTYLFNSKKFSIEVSRFIAAEVLLGLEYLHKNMKIIYRDLKPENILVSEDGHLKITDFGLAKHFKNESELTRTLRGTPEYIAPEVIKVNMVPNHAGYGLQCDIWAFGVFLYEMINGSPPFTDPNRNWPKIITKILENNPVFSQDFTDEAQDLIRKCLRNEPEKRPGWEEIRSHPFFSNIDWDVLLNKGIESPLKKLIPRRNGAPLQRPRPINETINNEAFEQLTGFTYDPKSFTKQENIM